MSTRRERMEARVERRREWAEKAEARAVDAFAKADGIASNIPLGQPILVGHHSEAKARRDANRIHDAMGRAVESSKLADRHASVADTLESRLATTVFSDDADAIEALEARIVEREAQANHEAAVNKAWRKGGIEAVRAMPGMTAEEASQHAYTMRLGPHLSGPCFVSNTRASVRRDRERLAQLKKNAAKGAK